MRAIPVSTTATLVTGKGIFVGASLSGGAGADATLLVYDGTGVTALILGDLAAKAGDSARTPDGLVVPFSTGCHAVIAGAGASGVVYVD